LGGDQVVLLQCNIDDMTGEALGYALDLLLSHGALDAWFTPIYMKKNRPATMLSVLCRPDDAERVSDLVLAHTTTLGVRVGSVDRRLAERRLVRVDTSYGPVQCKAKIVGGQIVSVKPEYEDCARLAASQNVSLELVRASALRAFYDRCENAETSAQGGRYGLPWH